MNRVSVVVHLRPPRHINTTCPARPARGVPLLPDVSPPVNLQLLTHNNRVRDRLKSFENNNDLPIALIVLFQK